MSLASILGVLSQGAQGAMQGYQYGQKQRTDAEQEAMRQQLNQAQLLNYTKTWANQDTDNARLAAQGEAAAKQHQDNQARSFLSTMLQAKQYGAANQFAQSNDSLRGIVGLAPGIQGPSNLGFEAPPVNQRPVVLGQGAQAIDPKTGKVLATGAPKTYAPDRTVGAKPFAPHFVTNDQGMRVPDGSGVRMPVKAPPAPKPASDADLRSQAKFNLSGQEPDSITASPEDKAAYGQKLQAEYVRLKRSSGAGPGKKSALDRLMEAK